MYGPEFEKSVDGIFDANDVAGLIGPADQSGFPQRCMPRFPVMMKKRFFQ